MATTNSVTGDQIATRFGNKETQEKYSNNFDTIFGKKPKKPRWTPPPLPLNEYPDQDWPEERIDRIGANGDGFPDKSHYE